MKHPSLKRLGWAAAAAAAAASAFAAALAIQRASREPRNAALVVDPEEVRAAASRSGYPMEDAWERLSTIGVSGLLLRPQTLSVLADRGDVLSFSPSEARKWIAAGLASPNSPVGPASLWIKDKRVLDHVARAAALRGIPFSTRTMGAVFVLDFRAPVDPSLFPADFDPLSLQDAVRHGFLPVFEAPSSGSLGPLVRQAAASEAGAMAFLLSPASSPEDPLRDYPSLGIRGLMDQGRAMAVFLPGEVGRTWGRFFRSRAERVLLAEHVSLDDVSLRPRRALLGRHAGMLIVHFSPRKDLEENLALLRGLRARLREEGFLPELSLPPRAPPRPSSPWGRAARRALAVVLGFLTPLLAVRQGLRAVEHFSGRQRWPRASPVAETVLGLAASILASLAGGALVYALLREPAWVLGLSRFPWALAAMWAPLIAGGALLYGKAPAAGAWPLFWRRSVTRGGLLGTVCALAAAFFLPRASLLDRLPCALWWLDRRWPEAAVGWPSLAVGLWVFLRRQQAGEGRERAAAASKPWIFFAVLGPAGALLSFGLARSSFASLAGQTASAAGMGCLIGAAAVLVLEFASHLERDRRVL